MAFQIANETFGFLIFLNVALHKRENNLVNIHHWFTHPCSNPLISQLSEGIHDDTKDNVQTDGGDNYEEGYVKQQTPSSKIEWWTGIFIKRLHNQRDILINQQNNNDKNSHLQAGYIPILGCQWVHNVLWSQSIETEYHSRGQHLLSCRTCPTWR